MSGSIFDSTPVAPPDPIFSLVSTFKADPRVNQKVSLIVGAYRTADDQPLVLKAVEKAEEQVVAQKLNKEYLPITGDVDYIHLATELHLGPDHPLLKSKNYFACQTVGGSGALCLASRFLVNRGIQTIHMSNPTWANHKNIFERNGLSCASYPYYDADTRQIDFDAMAAHLRTLKPQSLVLFHGCCHNPTGFDPSPVQWDQLCEIVKEQCLLPLFDFAYQGFGQGMDEDAYAVRLFAKEIPEMILCSSFSKNFGLYSERVGTLLIKTGSEDTADRVSSELKALIRSVYSNPPSHGPRIVKTILIDPDLKQEWLAELREMRERIASIREVFVQALNKQNLERDFSYLLEQRGMFSYSGLNPQEVEDLKTDTAVYITGSGRMNMAGLNPGNVDYVADSVGKVLSKTHA